MRITDMGGSMRRKLSREWNFQLDNQRQMIRSNPFTGPPPLRYLVGRSQSNERTGRITQSHLPVPDSPAFQRISECQPEPELDIASWSRVTDTPVGIT
jgi:hypothetical protein